MVSPENLQANEATAQPGTLNTVELTSETSRVSIQSQVLARHKLIAFVESLGLRSGELADGFVTDDERFRLVAETTNEELAQLEDLLAPASSWHASWRNPASGQQVHITVAKLTPDELQLKLGRERTPLAPDANPSGENPIVSDVAGVSLRYDPQSMVLLHLTVRGNGLSSAEVVDLLDPVGLDEWASSVEPYNADPLNPR